MLMGIGSVVRLLVLALLLLPYQEWHVVLSGTPLTTEWRDVSTILPCGSGVETTCWLPEPAAYNVGSPDA